MIVGYLVKINGKTCGFTAEPSTQLFQTKFGTVNFPDDDSVTSLFDAQHYTSPLGLLFTLYCVNILDK